jgi:D-serine deaminase-like pyridoxal phosphate-dependent protein
MGSDMDGRGRMSDVNAEECGSSEEELSAAGQSRRHWVVASTAVVAGSIVACGDTGGGGNGGGQGSACARGESEPAELPAFESDRCTDQIGSSPPPSDTSRFDAWNQELRARAAGRESALVDLDAVDHNLKLVGSQLGSRFALRLVAKSLPSISLLEYMMVTACTNRVMAFSEGMVRDLLCRFGSDVDILLGRPETADAAARTFATLDAHFAGDSNPAGAVRWLIDTPERLADYRDLADERGSTINIALEIDVGLRRGGALDNDELLAMLSIIDGSSRLQFTGFMGYEGHVPFAPSGIDPGGEFMEVQRRYAEFVRAGSEAFPALFGGSPLYNSGGSRTYDRYTNALDTPVNEVAMGSAFFYPANFADLPETELRRATFLASPVLKRIDPAEIPFARGLLPAMAENDPNLEVSFHVVGGGFPGEQLFPGGLVDNPVNPGAEGVNNLLSNQAEWLGSRQVALELGDFVFYHPWEGDGVRWLSRLDVFRNGELVDQWQTFQPGIRLT